jgi:hypothetical protein
MRKKVLLTMKANLNCFIGLGDSGEKDVDIESCTMIVGDSTFNGIYIPAEELEKSYKSFEGKPININHNSDTVEDIVGYMRNVSFKDGKITCNPVFDVCTSKYPVVMGYINSRVNSGGIPNVSIGIWADAIMEKYGEDEQERLVARNLEGDHLAVVVHGACSDSDGCGIGIGCNSNVTIPHDDYVANQDEYKKLEIEIDVLKEFRKSIDLKEEENVR